MSDSHAETTSRSKSGTGSGSSGDPQSHNELRPDEESKSSSNQEPDNVLDTLNACQLKEKFLEFLTLNTQLDQKIRLELANSTSWYWLMDEIQIEPSLACQKTSKELRREIFKWKRICEQQEKKEKKEVSQKLLQAIVNRDDDEFYRLVSADVTLEEGTNLLKDIDSDTRREILIWLEAMSFKANSRKGYKSKFAFKFEDLDLESRLFGPSPPPPPPRVCYDHFGDTELGEYEEDDALNEWKRKFPTRPPPTRPPLTLPPPNTSTQTLPPPKSSNVFKVTRVSSCY